MIDVPMNEVQQPEHRSTTAEYRDRIREFVITNFYVADPVALDDSASLLDSGIIDSTGVLELIAYVESEFGVQVTDDEIVPDNLDSIARIVEYLSKKRTVG